MQRATATILLMVISFAGALISKRDRSQDILFNISYLLAILLLISFLWTWINIRTVKLTRITRARRAQVGRSMEERFAVVNTSLVPKLWLEVRDYSDLPGHRASHVVKGLRSKGATNGGSTRSACDAAGTRSAPSASPRATLLACSRCSGT